MSTCEEMTTTIAQKDLVCDYCGCPIKKEQEYIRQVNYTSDYKYIFNSHKECFNLTGLLDMVSEMDEVTQESFLEALHAELQEAFGDDNRVVDISDYDAVKFLVKEYTPNKESHVWEILGDIRG